MNMNIFNEPIICHCDKPDCYFCNKRNKMYYTTPLDKEYILYHITKKKHIDTIFTNGLIANRYKGIFIGDKSKQYKKNIWLTDDVDYIIEEQLGWKRFYQEYTIIEVRLNQELYDKIQPYKSLDDLDKPNPHEFVIQEPIEKEYLKQIDYEKYCYNR